jgi:probable F420-dependent oxidoreductase
MKVGVNLLNFGPGAAPAALARSASLIEALGYHALLISDHVAITPDVAAIYPAPFYDPFLTLAWLASQTRAIELGTTVIILPYRHPLQVARLAANLDQLSGGRFILGVGAGWAAQEFAALGVPFAARGALTDDALEVIRASWAADVISHHSPFVAADDVATAPRPAQAPQLPIWVGGNGDVGRRRAVRHGAAWHPISIRVDWLRKFGYPRLQAAARDVDKPTPALCPRIKLCLSAAPLDDACRLAGQGSLAQVRQDLMELEELGAEYVVLDTYQGHPDTLPGHERDWAMLAALADQVLDLPHATVRG